MTNQANYKFSAWKPWNGGDCPLKDYMQPEVGFRSGGSTEAQASNLRWSHTGAWDDIIQYRVRLPVAHGIAP